MATILVVDDRPVNRSVLTTLLGYRGHRTLEAGSGLEALDKVSCENPDLVITDILMPKMDGYEFVRTLRRLQGIPQPRVIFYSATYMETETRALARACGVSSIILKPSAPEEVLKTVEEVLAAASEASANGDPPTTDETAVSILSNKLFSKVLELERLNSGLERRVAERTAELEQINRDLRNQMAEREVAEQEVAKSKEEQVRLKSEFLSHVSHELRSPLAVIHQFVTILLDGIGGHLSNDQRDYLAIVLRNVSQLKCMIDDLLEASRADLGKLVLCRSSIALADVVKDALDARTAFGGEKTVIYRMEMAPDLPRVYADPDRIFQVLTNLLDNAQKFSPEGGTVTVRAAPLPESADFVCLSVVDCGCGIEPEDARRVFERLYQVSNAMQPSRKGLGLGLYICKELVTQHEGIIWVDTQRRAGATIHFTLPVFSVARLIAPLLVHQGSTAPFLVLLTVQVSSINAWPSSRHRELCINKIKRALERCILGDLDILLPDETRGNCTVFSIIARADERGAAVMRSRIAENLQQINNSQPSSWQYSVETRLIATCDLIKDAPAEKHADLVGSFIQEQIVLQRKNEEQK